MKRDGDSPTPLYPFQNGEADNGKGVRQKISIRACEFFFQGVSSMTEVERIRRTKEYKQIRESLIDQLERSGNDTPHFLNLVEDYMSMYTTKELCKADISKRGINITSIGSTGQMVTKKNDSIDSSLKINQQMIKLLDMLGIKPDAGMDGLDEDM